MEGLVHGHQPRVKRELCVSCQVSVNDEEAYPTTTAPRHPANPGSRAGLRELGRED